MTRLLILIHRYLGIPLSVMFVVWFVSGVVMIYSGGLPSLSREEQLAHAEPIDVERIGLSPDVAWVQAGMIGAASGLRMTTVMGRPVFQYDTYYGRELQVFADTGDVLDEVSPERAALVAGSYLEVAADTVVFQETLTSPDQWTLALRGELPLHVFSVDDGSATRIYVSRASGKVALVTNRTSRFFAWIGVIPHWLYFTPLRMNQPLWYWTVVAVSALGCGLAAIGMALAFTRCSVRYRGWMRWHYLSGAIFGAFALTWVFSGLMSMEPFGWMNAEGLDVSPQALSGGDLNLELFPSIAGATTAGRVLNELNPLVVEYVQILGEPYFVATRSVDVQTRAGAGSVNERLHQPYPLSLDESDNRLILSADSLAAVDPFESSALIQAVDDATQEASIVSAEVLEEYDAYYYSRNGDAPLPVLRVKFDDPMSTWYYIDPVEARFVARTHRYSRIERWLFNGLHSLDFAFWYDKRPFWDVGIIALSLGALLTSGIGMFLGLRRILPSRGR